MSQAESITPPDTVVCVRWRAVQLRCSVETVAAAGFTVKPGGKVTLQQMSALMEAQWRERHP